MCNRAYAGFLLCDKMASMYIRLQYNFGISHHNFASTAATSQHASITPYGIMVRTDKDVQQNVQ